MQLFVFWAAILSIIIYFFWALYRNCVWDNVPFLKEDIIESFSHPFAKKRSVYISGTFLWLLLCIAMSMLLWFLADKVAFSKWDWILLLPAFGLIIYLAWNWKLSREESEGESKGKEENINEKSPYDREVELIKFVERHANYMIFAVTGVFIAAQYFTPKDASAIKPNFSMFYIFTFISL